MILSLVIVLAKPMLHGGCGDLQSSLLSFFLSFA